MLVQHDDTIPGISTFQKQLRDELRRNQIKYIQNMKTTPNPYRNIVNTPSPPPPSKQEEETPKETKEDDIKMTENATTTRQDVIHPLPLPYTKQGLPPMPHQIPPPPSHLGYHHLYPNPLSHVPSIPTHPGLPPMPAPFVHAQQQRQQPHGGLIHYHQTLPPPPHTHHHQIIEEQSPIDIPIDKDISQEIKTKIYRLGVKLPIAVPNVPWIYCPACKSFFTTFSKLNTHYNSQRHVIMMNGLSQEMKKKMYQLFEFIQLKQTEHLTKVQRK